MKTFYGNLILIFVIPFFLITLDSCRKDFEFEEIENLSTELELDGDFAIPTINSELTLANFIPDNDSSLWIEIDDDNLIHLRMFYDDMLIFKMNEIYPEVIPFFTYPINPGVPIPPQSYTVPTDTSKMSVYDRLISGKLYFQNPKITFFIENEIPVVTFFKMDTLTFYNFDTLAISHTDHDEYTIPAPSDQGTTADTTILIDTMAIPELAEVFSPVPRFISFYLTAGSHTEQTLPFQVSGEEEMKIDVDIDLPLDARLDTILITDTTKFFDTGGDIIDEIKGATIKIRFQNGFPIDAFSQIYITDSLETGEIGTIIDSLFTDLNQQDISAEGWHLNSAATDAQGIVISPTENNITIYIDQERFNNLINANASKMIISAKLNSYNSELGQFVKILGNYSMGVQISAVLEIEANTEDF